jgi:NADH-quinone oxidoreductase subunit M
VDRALDQPRVFLLSLILWARFDRDTAEFQFVERVSWLPEFGVGYHMGVDGISVLFVLLSTALTPICILASWEAITARVREYMVAFLVLETMMVGMFAALDMLVFYVFFEGVLIPMFLIIGVWGGARRVYAAYKFFLYTLLGSVLMLLAILYLWREAGTTDIPPCTATPSRLPRRHGSSSPSWPPSRSRCRCGRSTPGCPTRTWKRRPPAPSSSRACC